MIKTITLCILIVIAVALNAQDLEYEAAINACECLKSEKPIDDKSLEECITTSFAEVVSNAANEDKQHINTVTGIKTSLQLINEILTVICVENGEENYNQLEEKYYADSKDKVANSYYLTTQHMMDEGKYDLAAEGLAIAVGNDSTFVKAYDHLGICYRHLKNLDKSIFYYKKSLHLFPVGKIALMNLGLTYAVKGDIPNSNKYYKRLIRTHPGFAEGYYGIGKNYIMENNYDLGLKNICIAHQIYVESNSDYQKDTEKIIAIVYSKMKSEGKQKLFKKLAKKYNIEID